MPLCAPWDPGKPSTSHAQGLPFNLQPHRVLLDTSGSFAGQAFILPLLCGRAGSSSPPEEGKETDPAGGRLPQQLRPWPGSSCSWLERAPSHHLFSGTKLLWFRNTCADIKKAHTEKSHPNDFIKRSGSGSLAKHAAALRLINIVGSNWLPLL